jgi:replication factor C subunit 1
VSQSLDFTPILSNASDERNKSNIQDHLQGSLQNHSMYDEFWTNTPHKSVLIMDEIDEMSSGDRGGIAELIREMRHSKVSIFIKSFLLLCSFTCHTRIHS